MDAQDQSIIAALLRYLPEFNQKLNRFDFKMKPEQLQSCYSQLREREVITEKRKYPPVNSAEELLRFVDFRCLVGAVERYESFSFEEVLKENEEVQLGLSLSSTCEKLCTNCASSSTKNGSRLDFSRLEKLDQRYFPLFQSVAFGLEGEPFFYQWKGKNLGDVVLLLSKRGIREFSFLTGGFFQDNPLYENVVAQLEQLKKEGVKYKLEITYNLYVADLEKNDRSFLYTLNLASSLADEINIKVVGDKSPGETNYQNALKRLDGIFEEQGFFQEGKVVKKKRGEKEIVINKILTTLSCPMGRYKQKAVRERGERDVKKEENAAKAELPQLCRHLGYDEFIVNQKGGIRFCSEITSYDKSTYANWYEQSYEQVMEKLDQFHRKNYRWLKEHLPEIMLGESKSCMCERPCQEGP